MRKLERECEGEVLGQVKNATTTEETRAKRENVVKGEGGTSHLNRWMRGRIEKRGTLWCIHIDNKRIRFSFHFHSHLCMNDLSLSRFGLLMRGHQFMASLFSPFSHYPSLSLHSFIDILFYFHQKSQDLFTVLIQFSHTHQISGPDWLHLVVNVPFSFDSPFTPCSSSLLVPSYLHKWCESDKSNQGNVLMQSMLSFIHSQLTR